MRHKREIIAFRGRSPAASGARPSSCQLAARQPSGPPSPGNPKAKDAPLQRELSTAGGARLGRAGSESFSPRAALYSHVPRQYSAPFQFALTYVSLSADLLITLNRFRFARVITISSKRKWLVGLGSRGTLSTMEIIFCSARVRQRHSERAQPRHATPRPSVSISQGIGFSQRGAGITRGSQVLKVV